MKKSILFKLFTLFFIYLLFSFQSFAEQNNINILSGIAVEPYSENGYNINLFFDSKFNGNAYIQKKDKGNYYIFVPDTFLENKNTKIMYKIKKDKSNVKISVEEKPYIKENLDSNYVRLHVQMNDDYSLKLISKIKSDSGTSGFLNFYSLIIISLIGICIYIISRIIKMVEERRQPGCYTSFPVGFLENGKQINDNRRTIEEQRITIPKVNIKKSLKPADSTFSCFDIHLDEVSKSNAFDFKSSLQQTASIQKLSKTRTKTNPVTKRQETAEGLDIPAVEELFPKKEEQKKEQDNRAELLSELHITPNKGFYLTTINDSFSLFGFVNDNVFLLKNFEDLSQINLQARFYDKNGDNDIYIVRLDTYKAMVEISDTKILELAVL